MKFDQDLCLNLQYDFGKMNSTLGSVVPLAMFFNWAHPLDWATQKMLRLAPPLNFLSVGITFTSPDT